MQVEQSYIKQTFDLAWRFFSLNKAASFIVLGILFFLAVFSAIPIIGFFVSMAFGLFIFALQIYVAKVVLHSKTDADYENNIKTLQPKNMLTRFVSIAMGAYLGMFILQMIALFLIFASIAIAVGSDTMIALSNGSLNTVEQMQVFQNLGIIGVVIMIFIMFFAYIYPLVIGRVYMMETFGDAFKSIFLIFSPELWKKTFNKRYFILISVVQLVFFGLVIVIALTMMSIVLIPIAVLITYFILLTTPIMAIIAHKISYGEQTQEIV